MLFSRCRSVVPLSRATLSVHALLALAMLFQLHTVTVTVNNATDKFFDFSCSYSFKIYDFPVLVPVTEM